MKIRTHAISNVTSVAVLLAFSSLVAFGQATDAALTGAVTDPAGATVGGASVIATNVATNVKWAAQTSDAGFYRFGNLPAGFYDLTVTHAGFSTTTLRNIRLDLNSVATANVSLTIGEVTTSIEVTDTAPLIDTTTAQIRSTYQAREAIDLPASAQTMGVMNLALLGAGVASSGGIGLGEGPVVGGQRPRNNSFNIEGVDNNRKDVTGHTVDVPNEAVAEFSALLNQYSAEFGNGTGGQFNTTLRSGSNQVHGALFEYFNNRNLNAVDQSLARQGIRSNPRFDDNTLGGSIGGPIVKDKLFYYGLYSYNPRGNEGAASSAIYAPTVGGYTTLSSMPGLSQTNLGVLKQYLAPAPSAERTTSVLGQNIPIGILPVTKPSFSNQHNWLTSWDYTLSEKDNMRFRYISNNKSGFDESTLPALPTFFQGRTTTAKLATFSEFHTFSPSLLNEFRAGYQRFNDDIPSGNYTFPGLDAFPNITIEQDLNLQLGPYDTSPQSTVINMYQGIDNVTWNKGRHTVKAGAEFRKYISPTLFIQRQRGDYGYNTVERFLLDQAPDVLAERSVGGAPYNGNQINVSWFVNDSFKVSRSLSLELGLRWEYKSIPKGDQQWELNKLSSVPGLIQFRTPKAMKNAFAPRVGLAYSPGKTGTTVFRFGFGMAYDKYFDNISTNTRPPQVSSVKNVSASEGGANFLKNGGIPATAAGEPVCVTVQECRDATTGYLYDQQLPYSIQWNAGVQHSFAKDFTLEVRYLGTRGVHLLTQSRINVDAVVNPTRNIPTYLQTPSASTLAGLPYQLGDLLNIDPIKAEYQPYFDNNFITAFPYRGNSSYHGLATELTRRFSRGLLFRAAYTWSHALDDSTADLFSTLLSPRRPQNFQDMRSEKSSSFLDRRHRFTYSWVWDTPWFTGSSNAFLRNGLGNFTLSGTYTYETPQYATVQSGVDANLNLDAASDRAIVNPNGVPNTGTTVTPINRAGAVVPVLDPSIVAYVAKDPTAQYIVAQYGAMANGSRQTMATRPINNWDVQVKKQFVFGERYRLQVAAQLINLFNHAQYIPGYLNTVLFHDSNDTRNNLIPGNPVFNRPDLVYDSNSRTMQLTARFQY